MKSKIIMCILLLHLAHVSIAQKHWSFELHGGAAYNVPLPLTIKQNGFDDIKIKRARFAAEPFISPYYWDWRFGKWNDKWAIEFEAIHNKLFLKNYHPDIQRFGISHGFNILCFNYAQKYRGFIGRIGLGSVLLHAESTIRNKVYTEGPGFDIKGYRLRGLVLNLAIARKFYIIPKYLFCNVELKSTFAKANAPIVDGYAKVNNIAHQAIAGLGVDFLYRKNKGKK